MVHSSPELVEGVNRELYDSHTWKNPSWTLWTAHRFKSCCTSYTCESAHRLESVKRRICTSSRYSDNPSFANEWLHSARCILPMVLAVECVAAGLTISCSIHRWDDFYTRRCFQYAQYSCVDNSKSTRYKSTCIPTTLLCEFYADIVNDVLIDPRLLQTPLDGRCYRIFLEEVLPELR